MDTVTNFTSHMYFKHMSYIIVSYGYFLLNRTEPQSSVTIQITNKQAQESLAAAMSLGDISDTVTS